MANQWTIRKAEGGRDSTALVGCKIQESDDGLHYEFTMPNNEVLSTTTGSTLPEPPFAFPEFAIPGGSTEWNWNISVETLTGGHHQNKAKGSWTNTDPSPAEEESGTWTAQAGSGMGEEGTEDVAYASA